MHEKKLPYIVRAELIHPDEAKQARHEAFNGLGKLLKKIIADLTKLPVADRKSSQVNLNALKSIQSKLEVLGEYIEKAEEDNFNTKKWTQLIKSIINLFEQIDDYELKALLIGPETDALLAQFKIALIADANSIIDNPNAALIDYEDFTFSGEYERLGREFQALFPRFLGYRVEMGSRHNGFSIDLKEGSPTISSKTESPAEAIEPLIVEFLSWQLRKIGFTLMFEFVAIDQNGMICEIAIVDSEDPLRTIIDYQQAQVETSEIDVKNMSDFLIDQLKTEVDSDWEKRPYERAEFYPPVGKITIKSAGKWLWIKAQVIYGGVRWDPSTDRHGGDFEATERWYDWVGLARTAPKRVTHPEELRKWAEITTSYFIHNLLHEGSEILEITEEGEVKIRADTFRYPNIESKYEQIALE